MQIHNPSFEETASELVDVSRATQSDIIYVRSKDETPTGIVFVSGNADVTAAVIRFLEENGISLPD